ncbi:MAG: hypothetical protein U0235_09055 [Polyangiaceae bacterium]
MKLGTYAFGFALLVVVACSSSSSSSGGGGPAPATPGTQSDLDSAAAARIKDYCDRVFNCCDAVSASKLVQVYAGGDVKRDGCEAGVKEWLKTTATSAATALQRKDLEFYPSKEATCLKDDQGKSCSDFFALGQATEPKLACGDAFTGKVKEGSGCTSNAACASGYCKLNGESGLCAPFPQEGDSCTSTIECGGGNLYCDRTLGPPACKFGEGKCKPRDSKADGQPCCNPEECEGQSCNPTNKGPQCNHSNQLKCNK